MRMRRHKRCNFAPIVADQRVPHKLDTFATERYPLINVGDESECLYTLQQKDTAKQETEY